MRSGSIRKDRKREFSTCIILWNAGRRKPHVLPDPVRATDMMSKQGGGQGGGRGGEKGGRIPLKRGRCGT